MNRTGKVRVSVLVFVAAGSLAAGGAVGGGARALEAGDLGAAIAPGAIPGSLLAVAHWGLFSHTPLSYLPWESWREPAPGESALEAVVRRPRDRSEGGPVEVGGDSWARYEYCDTFGAAWHREDATIEGLSCLRWDPGASRLELRGSRHRRRVSLLYHFVSPYVMKDTVAELTGEIEGEGSDRIELALSPDGEHFGHAVGAFGCEGGNRFLLTTNASERFHTRGFWVRLRGELSPEGVVRLRRFRLANRVKPPGRPEVALERADEGRLMYRDDFRSRKLFHLAEIENAEALGWQRGRVFVRGGEQGARVEVRQRFVSPDPLRAIAVRVSQAAAGGNEFALSLDGRTLLAVAKARAADDGTMELTLDDPRLASARQFYLHMRLASDAGSALSCVEVEARTADAATATAAATPADPVRHD